MESTKQAEPGVDPVQSNAWLGDSEALASWWPWWRKPVLMSDWEQLLSQAKRLAELTTMTHREAKTEQMPFWFVQKTAHTKWKACRKYWRVKRRLERCKHQAASNLLQVLGLRDG